MDPMRRCSSRTSTPSSSSAVCPWSGSPGASARTTRWPSTWPSSTAPRAADRQRLIRYLRDSFFAARRFSSVEDLKAIGLAHTATELDDPVALATKRLWSATQLLEHIALAEQRERAQHSLERRIGRSRLGHFKPFVDFDWAWPKRIDRNAVETAMQLDFLAAARNVVFVAAQGLGKTMIAQNIIHAALLAGHAALFVTAAQLLLDLAAQVPWMVTTIEPAAVELYAT
jgi:DNA replication protein DnaC